MGLVDLLLLGCRFTWFRPNGCTTFWGIAFWRWTSGGSCGVSWANELSLGVSRFTTPLWRGTCPNCGGRNHSYSTTTGSTTMVLVKWWIRASNDTNLSSLFVPGEIKAVVARSDGKKSQGLDGFNFSFFKRFCDLLKGDARIIFDNFFFTTNLVRASRFTSLSLFPVWE